MRELTMEEKDGIKNRGFLSAEIEKYRKDYRAAFAHDFAVCEEKSDAATKRLFGADLAVFDVKDKLHVIVAIAHWLRCVSACQGALLLLERGMVPEGQTLIRTAFEFLFYAVAGLKDLEVLESLIQGDSYARKVQADSMKLEGKKAGELTQEQIDALAALVQEHSDGERQIDVFEAARRAGMAYLYPTVYRGMSFIAAHPTLAATEAVIEKRGAGFGLTFGPSDTRMGFSIGLIDYCLAEGAKHFNPILQPAT